MNAATFFVLASLVRPVSWADSVEANDDTLPPLPLTWVKAANESVKVWQEEEWTTVEHKKKPRRRISSKALGSKRNI
jgi:hypothetical protein